MNNIFQIKHAKKSFLGMCLKAVFMALSFFCSSCWSQKKTALIKLKRNLGISQLYNPADKFISFLCHRFTEHLETALVLYVRTICMYNIDGEFCEFT